MHLSNTNALLRKSQEINNCIEFLKGVGETVFWRFTHKSDWEKVSI